MVFVCYLLLKEANIHMNLIFFDHNFYHLHINVVVFVPRKHPKRPQVFPQKHGFLKKKVLNIYQLLGLSSRFSQNSRAVLKKLLINVLLKNRLKTPCLTSLVQGL